MRQRSELAEADAGSRIKESYLVGPILRACELLKAFHSAQEVLPLHELVTRTGLNKTTAFRAAQSLVAGGLLMRVGGEQYRCLLTPCNSRTTRIGYASMSGNSIFSSEISESLRIAASTRGVELVELDNQLSARTAIRNAERFIHDGVDLAIEFQVHQRAAATISAKFNTAGIPLIAIHTPHPGATFFGGNNYSAGRIAGRALGRWALSTWEGKIDSILLLAHSATGPLTQSRLTGTAMGISDILGGLDPALIVNLEVKGGYAETMETVIKYLARTKCSKILVGCINDAVALGAVRAFAEADRSEDAAIIGQNGTIPARYELRRRDSRLIGTVGFFAERYGDQLLSLARDILEGKQVAPAVFIKHALLTRQNVDELYPNDALTVPPDPNSLLFNRYH